MKTQKEMLELFVESNLFNSMDYNIEDEYPTFDANKDDARTFIFDRCMDGANIFDFIPLAIDQCLSKEDGIALIDEILTSLMELPPGEDIPEAMAKSVEFRNLIRKDIWDTIVEKGMYLHDKDLLDISSAEVLANLDDIDEPPMVHHSANGQELCLYFINNDIIFTEHFPAKYPETQVWGMDENTYDWFINVNGQNDLTEELLKDEEDDKLDQDAQAAEHYINLYYDEDIEESVNWLHDNGYPHEGIKYYDDGEPKSNDYKSVWKSPDFRWLDWYQGYLDKNAPKVNPKLDDSELGNDLKLALEDSINQIIYLERETGRNKPKDFRFTSKASIINLRTQLERLFPDSKLIEQYKEVTLD